MASRHAGALAKKAAVQEPQLRSYCFNLKGHALKEPFVTHTENELITTHKFVSKSSADIIKSGPADVFRTSLEFTDQEREEKDDDPKYSRCVVVGYAPRKHNPKWDVIAMKAGSFGTKTPDQTIEYDDKEQLMYVVTPLTDSSPAALKYYALLQPKDGLCTPCTISIKNVFLRWEFRSDVVSYNSRVLELDSMVKQVSVRGAPIRGISDKQIRFGGPASQGWPITFDSKLSLSNEISTLALMYEQKKDKYFLEEMKIALESVDDDTKYAPPQQKEGLRAFCDRKAMKERQAESLVKEASESWPSMEGISAATVMRLKKSLEDGELHLPYRHLGPFLKETAHMVKEKGEMTDAEMIETSKAVIATAERMLPGPKSRASITTDRQLALAECLKTKLEEIQSAGLEQNEKIRAALGDNSVPGTPEQIWKRFAESPDTDAAGNVLMHQVKMAYAYLRQSDQGMRNMIGEIVLLLENLLRQGGKEA